MDKFTNLFHIRFADGLFRAKSFIINVTKDTGKANSGLIWIQGLGFRISRNYFSRYEDILYCSLMKFSLTQVFCIFSPPKSRYLFMVIFGTVIMGAELFDHVLKPVYMKWVDPLASWLASMLARFYMIDPIMSQPGASSEPALPLGPKWKKTCGTKFNVSLLRKYGTLQSNVECKKFNILSSKHAFTNTTSVHDIVARNSDNLVFLLEIHSITSRLFTIEVDIFIVHFSFI